MYGYESSATLTTDRLQHKLQARPLVREGAPRRRAKQISGKRKEKVKSGHGPQRGAPTPRHTDWLTVSLEVTSISSDKYSIQLHELDGSMSISPSLCYQQKFKSRKGKIVPVLKRLSTKPLRCTGGGGVYVYNHVFLTSELVVSVWSTTNSDTAWPNLQYDRFQILASHNLILLAALGPGFYSASNRN
jgi:hypothetical protein